MLPFLFQTPSFSGFIAAADGVDESGGLFLLFCGASLLLFIIGLWDGWRNGLGRKLFSLAGMLLGAVAAISFRQPLASVLERFIGYPGMVLQFLAAALIFILILGVAGLLGILFCKKTSNLEGTARARSGIGGMILGGLISLGLIIGAAVGLRIGGRIADSFVSVIEPRVESRIEAKQKAGQASDDDDVWQVLMQQKKAMRLLKMVTGLQAEIDSFPGAGPLVASVDPMEEGSYTAIDKMARVLDDEQALKAMGNQPATRDLLQLAAVENLMEDAEIRQLANARDLHGLMSHPKLRAALEDPEVMAAFADFPLNRELDAALAAGRPAAGEQ